VFCLPDLPHTAPLAVFIHGGYWQELSLDISDGPALGFHSLGWRTVSLGYDMAPAVNMDQIVQQVRLAGRRILHLAAELRSSSILLFGHSAGAHLVAMLLADWSTLPHSERPLAGAAVYLSGVFDLEPLLETTVNEPLRMDVECARRNSPMYLMRQISQVSEFAHVVLVGAEESREFHRQSSEFAAALEEERSVELCGDVESGVSKSGDEVSKCDEVVSKCEEVSRCDKVVSKSDKIVSKCEDVVSKTEYVMPKSDQVVSKSDQVVSKSDSVVSEVLPGHDHFSICEALADPNSDVMTRVVACLQQLGVI